MASATPKKAAKSESLAIRLAPKTRFMLDFVARARGQNITTVVERAIFEAAANVRVEGLNDELTWQDVWTESEGTRALRFADIKGLFPTYEEERRLNFAHRHWPFFYTDERLARHQTMYIDILWPRIDEFMQINDDKKLTDAFAAGRAMQEALRAAKLEAPEWPPKPPKPKPTDFGRAPSDEIPF